MLRAPAGWNGRRKETAMHGTKLSQVNPATMPGYGDCDPPEACDADAPECVECGEPMEVEGPEAYCPACGHCEEPDYEAMSGRDC